MRFTSGVYILICLARKDDGLNWNFKKITEDAGHPIEKKSLEKRAGGKVRVFVAVIRTSRISEEARHAKFLGSDEKHKKHLLGSESDSLKTTNKAANRAASFSTNSPDFQ